MLMSILLGGMIGYDKGIESYDQGIEYTLQDLRMAFNESKILHKPLYKTISDTLIKYKTYINKTEARRLNTTEYVCRHFAVDIGKLFEEAGYDVEIESGKFDGSKGTHAMTIIRIPVSNGEVMRRDFLKSNWTKLRTYTVDEYDGLVY